MSRTMFSTVLAICTATQVAMAGPALSPSKVDQTINAVLNLENSWHARLDVPKTPNTALEIRIPYGGETLTLDLQPASVRSTDYHVLMQADDGSLYEVEPGPVRTLRGTVLGYPGSTVAGSLMENGLHATIHLSADERIWMEPIGDRIRGLAPDTYAFYRQEDIISSDGVCATADPDVSKLLEILGGMSPHGAFRGATLYVTELGCDTDYEYYQDWGSQTESRINQVINAVNSQYEGDVAITHEITTIIIRSSSSDPYTTNDPSGLLSQFRSEWINNQGGVQRDVAHLFTGREIDGGVIGIAYDIGAICTSNAYCLSQSDCCGSFGCATDLTAHELGHLWGGWHCDCTSYTMNPYITCSNQFSSGSISSIVSHRNSRWCLDTNEPPPTGACCVGSSCVTTTEANCSGTWYGANSNCGSVTCTVPTGACCVDETCSETTQADCSGTFYGVGTTCADISCIAVPTDLNATQVAWTRSDGQSMVTYDLYFPSVDADSRLVSVFGENADLLTMQAWSNANFDGSASPVSFHHSQYGDDVPHDRALDAPLGIDLVYDAYVTIGSDDAAVGVPLLLGFDSAGFNSAAGASMDNGVWFVIPDDAMASIGAGTALGHPAASLSVEAGQGVEVLLNVQFFDGGGTVHQSRGINWTNENMPPLCQADIDGSGAVDTSDLLQIIAAWGDCGGCAEDIDGSGTVDVVDLLSLINAWGPC
ncbi:MAG: M12 family metallo-peptidase [Phycisphaerales bacterium]|nr:M12 family metallo-peptidase [Phycisphaerales bacterium]